MLVDFENLLLNIDLPPAEHFSLMEGFDRVIRQISQEVGEIVNIFVFAPPHLALLWGEDFHRQGFFTILCPKVRSKEGAEEDTTDATIVEFGRKIITEQRITHLCLGSGDRDFIPFVREAIRQGLKIIVIAADLRSLASELIRLVDKKPSGERMVYLFSPIGEE
jgi:hypothetical protein